MHSLLKRLLVGVVFSAALWPVKAVSAHALPVSYLDVKLDDRGASVALEASVKDWKREAPSLDGEMLLSQHANEQGKQLLALLGPRLQLSGDGQIPHPHMLGVEPLPDLGDVRLRLRYDWPRHAPKQLRVECRLFPLDPNHKTFLALYRGANLEREDIFDTNLRSLSVSLSTPSPTDRAEAVTLGTFAVVRRFVREGVHHIFIGPDHILFIVGLLLLGGTLWQLLKVVTCFTVAHSLTLALATLGILDPPARVVEPLIALSIVFVGFHDLRQLRAYGNAQSLPHATRIDARLILAFGFGLIHGFGFAGVLRELELPRAALFWSLGAFNLGVEVGQMCIVLSVAPLLALLSCYNRPIAARVTFAGALIVVAVGTFWFVQRVAFSA